MGHTWSYVFIATHMNVNDVMNESHLKITQELFKLHSTCDRDKRTQGGQNSGDHI